MTLALVPPLAPTVEDRVTDLVARLRAAKLRAIAAGHRGEQYAAVIIATPRGQRHGGQYRVTPVADHRLRIRWHPTDRPAVAVDITDTPERAAALILDHLAGLYP